MPWAKSFCPLPLLYPSASDFQFRYAPVTVGSGRVELTCKNCVKNYSKQLTINRINKHYGKNLEMVW